MKGSRHKKIIAHAPHCTRCQPRQKNSMHKCHCQLMKKSRIIKTSFKSTSYLDLQIWWLEKNIWADSQRTLRAVVVMRRSPSHPRSVSHSVFTCFVSPFHWLHGIGIPNSFFSVCCGRSRSTGSVLTVREAVKSPTLAPPFRSIFSPRWLT